MSGERLDLGAETGSNLVHCHSGRHTPLRARSASYWPGWAEDGICLSTSPDVITIGKDGRMNQPTDDPLVSELEQASIDSAEESEEQHEHERAAAHKQGLIQSETRQHGLDDS